MVSADGPSVTPDGGEPDKVKTGDIQSGELQSAEQKPVSRIARDHRAAPPGAGNGHAESPPDENGASSAEAPEVAPKTKKKPRKRRLRLIDRQVMEFQPDAVEMEHRKVAGGLRWTLYVVILLLISTIAWASWARVDRLVVAEGKLVVAETIVIQPTSTSPIRSFDVQFGQTVRSGDVLVTLDPTMPGAEVSKLEAQINGLNARIARLTAEQTMTEFEVTGHDDDPVWLTERLVYLDRQREEESKREQFAAERRKLDATKNKHLDDVRVLTSRLAKMNRKLASTRDLFDRQVSTETELMNDEIQAEAVDNQLVNARNSILETDADMESLKKREAAELSSRKAQISSDLAESRQTYASIFEELNKARRASELATILVPEHPLYDEFVVVEVAERNVGSVVQPGDSLVRLIPAAAEREVECKVQSQDIARIRELESGEARSVRIKLSAFPYMKHGTLEGRIRAISEDISEEGQAPMTRAYYRVRVEITNDTLKDVPANHRLIPGMAATAEIKVGTRRVIDYFLYPLFRSLDSSIREP